MNRLHGPDGRFRRWPIHTLGHLLLAAAEGNRSRMVSAVMAGRSGPKDGVASLAYVPAIHAFFSSGANQISKSRRGCPRQARA